MDRPEIQRAEALLQQHRPKQAIDLLRQVLLDEPHHFYALVLLANAYMSMNDMEKAKQSIGTLLQMAPDTAYPHALMAQLQYVNGENVTAMTHIDSAIALAPEDASYRGLKGRIHFANKDWKEALACADKGLSFDASDLNCLNLRSESLIKLNRKEEALHTMDKALERDAENADTHASNGWNYLEAGDHKKALEHFTLALQLDPMNHSAKVGMKEALKAKKPFYRLFLRYSFFMGKLKGGTQWVLILGAYFGVRYLGKLAESNPEFEKFIIPVIILYTLFALSTWVISPLANLFLRTDPQGKFALDEQEVRVGNFTAASVAFMLIGLLIALYGFFLAEPPNALQPRDWKDLGYICFGFGFLMLLPLATLLGATDKNRLMIRSATVVLGLLGLFAIYSVFMGADLIGQGTMPFLFGMFLYQFFGGYLANNG